MVNSRSEAVKNALASHTNKPGTCQLWTRTMLGAPSAGDRDRDGDADAVDGWKSEPEWARHTDRNPPAGVPVAWSGGRNGYGHRAISLGNGKIRSTDAGGPGRVATVDLDWIERNWGLRYLGWSETITGISIPNPRPKIKVHNRVASVNVPRKIGLKGLRECWDAAEKRADVLMFQECFTMKQRNEYHRLAKRDGFKQVGLWRTPNPIFFRKTRWIVTARARYRLHKKDTSALGKKYPGYGAARWLTVAAAKPRRGGPKTGFLNMHWVAEGKKTDPDFRKKARAQSTRVVNDKIGNQLRLSRIAVVGGDTNEPGSKNPVLRDLKWYHSGVDKIGLAVPKSRTVRNQNGSPFKAPTDHKYGKLLTFDYT